MITHDLLRQAIESFPLTYDPVECAPSITEQDVKLAGELMQSFASCPEFHGMSSHLREVYFLHGMQIWAFINIARVWIQVGMRLHSLEMLAELSANSEKADEKI